MNYQVYSNPFYIQDLQNMKDRIDSQIRHIQQNQIQQPQPITQNFQIAPQNNSELESKYANNIDEVKNTFVMKTGVFVNKDFSNLWVKDVNGNVRAFSTVEIFEMDDKDKEILNLKKQIEEMKGMINNEYNNTKSDESVTSKKSSRTSSSTKSNAK